jgi:hypothetical protein
VITRDAFKKKKIRCTCFAEFFHARVHAFRATAKAATKAERSKRYAACSTLKVRPTFGRLHALSYPGDPPSVRRRGGRSADNLVRGLRRW